MSTVHQNVYNIFFETLSYLSIFLATVASRVSIFYIHVPVHKDECYLLYKIILHTQLLILESCKFCNFSYRKFAPLQILARRLHRVWCLRIPFLHRTHRILMKIAWIHKHFLAAVLKASGKILSKDSVHHFMAIACEGAIKLLHFSRSGAIAFKKAKTSIYAWNMRLLGTII